MTFYFISPNIFRFFKPLNIYLIIINFILLTGTAQEGSINKQKIRGLEELESGVGNMISQFTKKRNFKWASMQKWQSTIYNCTIDSWNLNLIFFWLYKCKILIISPLLLISINAHVTFAEKLQMKINIWKKQTHGRYLIYTLLEGHLK